MITAAKLLVDSIRTLVEISEAESVSLERSRERASQIESIFRSAMRDRIEGRSPSVDMTGLMGQDGALDDVQERQRQSEESFLDAHRHLTHLYALPDLRDDVEGVLDILRQWRMVRYDDRPSDFQQDMPSPDTIELAGTEADRLASHLGFMGGIGDAVHARQEKLDGMIARSDGLLAQALAAAEALASKA